MTSDTLKQKYLVNLPLLDNELPMFKSELNNKCKSIRLPLSSLQKKDVNSFKSLVADLKKMDIEQIIIYNDINILSNNIILTNAITYYTQAFAYWFKKNKFYVSIA